MVVILMMSAKLVNLGFLEMKIFWNKVYDVKIFVHDVTRKNLLRKSNYITDVAMWPKFGNFIMPMREVIITSIL